MATKVKTHKRKKKNGVSVVREHSRKDGKTSKRGSGAEYEKKSSSSCDTSQCTISDLKDAEKGKWGGKAAKKAHKELKKRGKDTCD